MPAFLEEEAKESKEGADTSLQQNATEQGTESVVEQAQASVGSGFPLRRPMIAPGAHRTSARPPGRHSFPLQMSDGSGQTGGERKPWDVGRFAQSVAFFNGPIDVIKRVLPKPPSVARSLVWSTTQPELLEWGQLDDVIMGGVSQSSFVNGVFSGFVSTDNNGGFAGTRSKALTPALDLSAYEGLRLRVRGDGKRYKIILRDDYGYNGIAWAASFDTEAGATEFQEVTVLFSDFVPTLFARRVPGRTLDTRNINTVQLSLSKFEYDDELNPAFGTGPFKLELESIEAF